MFWSLALAKAKPTDGSIVKPTSALSSGSDLPSSLSLPPPIATVPLPDQILSHG